MRLSVQLLFILILSLSQSAAPEAVAAAAEGCERGSTVETKQCLLKQLRAKDEALLEALERVALMAAESSMQDFHSRWRRILQETYQASSDPALQFDAFVRQRRQVCAYSKSIAFGGSGFSGFMYDCELALTQALLQQLPIWAGHPSMMKP